MTRRGADENWRVLPRNRPVLTYSRGRATNDGQPRGRWLAQNISRSGECTRADCVRPLADVYSVQNTLCPVVLLTMRM